MFVVYFWVFSFLAVPPPGYPSLRLVGWLSFFDGRATISLELIRAPRDRVLCEPFCFAVETVGRPDGFYEAGLVLFVWWVTRTVRGYRRGNFLSGTPGPSG